MRDRLGKVWCLDVQGLHEWALENNFDCDHFSLNKLIELYELQSKAIQRKVEETDDVT